jgi:hypothetical protein
MTKLIQNLAKFSLLFFVTLLSCHLQADASHQFSLSLSHSNIEYLDGNATYRSISGSAYFKPVEKSAALPYSRTAFYTRTGSFSISAAQQEWEDMLIVIGPSVFKSGDIRYYSTSTFLAKSDLPVWGSLRYQYLDEMRYNFADGSHFNSPSESIKQATLGGYIQDTLSLYAFYSKQEPNNYGAGIIKLFNLSEFGFLEAQLQLSQTDKKDKIANIQANVVRNLDVSSDQERSGYVAITYFPFVQTALKMSYQRIEHMNLNLETNYFSTGIEQYLFDAIRLGLNYTHTDTHFIQSFGDSETYNLSLSFDF